MLHEKLIVMYSPQSGVGQTTTAVQLAYTLAKQEAEGLLMDWGAHRNGGGAVGWSGLTEGLRDWMMNDAPGGLRLGHERYTLTTGCMACLCWQVGAQGTWCASRRYTAI